MKTTSAHLSVVKPSKGKARVKKQSKAMVYGKGIAGAVFGASASGIAYITMHLELKSAAAFNLRVFSSGIVLVGCLLFSAPTAYDFFLRSFRHKGKAVGLVVLFELCMLSSSLPWLAAGCAILLMMVNGFNAGWNFSQSREETNPIV